MIANDEVPDGWQKSLGYSPLVLKVLDAKPEHSVHPDIVSKAPSIKALLADEDRTGYDISLHNVSRRGVVSYTVSENDGFSLSSYSHRKPLIAGGAERHQRIEPASRKVVIAAALFSDGSHEGESKSAAQLESAQIGYRSQERRAIPIIDRIIKNPAPDDNARVTRIRNELTTLSNDPDDSAIDIMQAHYPDLPRDVIRDDLKSSFNNARINIWSELYGYIHSSGQYPPPVHPPPLTGWLATRP